MPRSSYDVLNEISRARQLARGQVGAVVDAALEFGLRQRMPSATKATERSVWVNLVRSHVRRVICDLVCAVGESGGVWAAEEQYRRRRRKEIADELRGARQRLRSLAKKKSQILEVSERIARGALNSSSVHAYQNVPLPMLTATREGTGVPAVSGIYFVYSSSLVAYVGQSINLNSRCRLGNHHAIYDGEQIAWLPCPVEQLNFSEAFYIGVTKPNRNFGGRVHRTIEEDANRAA
jgi:hypothetical protein